MTTRVEGEITRAHEQVKRMRDTLDSVEALLTCLRTGSEDSIGFDTPQSVLISAGVLAATLSRLDAYQRAEQDAKPARLSTDRCRCRHLRKEHFLSSGHCPHCDCERFFERTA